MIYHNTLAKFIGGGGGGGGGTDLKNVYYDNHIQRWNIQTFR